LLTRATQLAAFAYLLLLSWFTMAPDPWFPLFGGYGRQVETTVDTSLADAAQHAGAYGVLGFLLVRAALAGGWPSTGLTVTVAVVHGLVTELVQYFVPLRTCDWTDAVSNVAGAAAGAAFAMAVSRVFGTPRAVAQEHSVSSG
ncbi:MAG: VanZ family protein, partial [Planctomycetaceae bacterium]|nr:VanZ family protein [Planctomycetaceae bacterium]